MPCSEEVVHSTTTLPLSSYALKLDKVTSVGMIDFVLESLEGFVSVAPPKKVDAVIVAMFDMAVPTVLIVAVRRNVALAEV